MSVLPRESTGEGDYYLAPTVQFAKVGLGNRQDEQVYVDENGENHYGVENIFKTELKTFDLDLTYDSSNPRDNFSSIGHWRTSFNSSLDFAINALDIKDKSNFYTTAREACESGFEDIKETVYRGILLDATSVYDKNADMCILKRSGEEIGKFVVWNKSQKRDDIHYLTTAKGEFLVFVKNSDGNFTTEHEGLMLTLSEEANGTFSYKDASDVLRRYDAKGRLAYLMEEGQETHVAYDANGNIAQVKGAMDNVLEFHYDDENVLKKISTTVNGSAAWAEFNYNAQKMLSNHTISMEDENKTIHPAMSVSYVYDAKNLLKNVEVKPQDMGEGEILQGFLVNYEYDALNRVASVDSNGSTMTIGYEANKITKVLPTGKKAVANIAFKGSKQVISDITDETITSEYNYNDKGMLSEVVVSEEVTDANASGNITANALKSKKTLNIKMDYNAKGLISSQYLETSDGLKKFTSYEYKSTYNKPTKILTDEEVGFFDFDNKGQLIKMSYLKFDKEMKIKPHSLEEIKQEAGYEESTYAYDENGFLKTISNGVDGTQTHYTTQSDGHVLEDMIVEHGWMGGVNYDARPSSSRVAMVSGAMGESIRQLYWPNAGHLGNMQHYYWEQVSFSGKSDIFDKGSSNQLIVIGHSWGADSAMSAATRQGNINMLVTLDAVGYFRPSSYEVARKTNAWVNVYADPGRQFGYWKVEFKCKRKGWKIRCTWHDHWVGSQWTSWDWVAWSGGKYNSIHGADANIKVTCHHDEVNKMVNVMQSYPSYNLNLRTK